MSEVKKTKNRRNINELTNGEIIKRLDSVINNLPFERKKLITNSLFCLYN